MNVGDMQIEVRKLSELRHPDRNARLHPDKQIAELKRSLQKDGQTRLMVVDEKGVIWIGNGLYQAMVEMGYTEAYCIVKSGMSEIDKKKMMYSDNRIFDLGVDDMKAFDDFIAELDGDLDVPGFDDDLLRSLKADAPEIDEILSGYGIITEEKKAEITEAGETYRKAEEARASRPDPAPASPAGASPYQTVQREDSAQQAAPESGRYIICPKCGEKICL